MRPKSWFGKWLTVEENKIVGDSLQNLQEQLRAANKGLVSQAKIFKSGNSWMLSLIANYRKDNNGLKKQNAKLIRKLDATEKLLTAALKKINELEAQRPVHMAEERVDENLSVHKSWGGI